MPNPNTVVVVYDGVFSPAQSYMAAINGIHSVLAKGFAGLMHKTVQG